MIRHVVRGGVFTWIARMAPFLLLALAWPHLGRGGERDDDDRRLFISSASADLANNVLTIRGRHLAGSRLRVRLGESTLEIISSSSSEILARLPAGLAAASYRLMVTRGKHAKHSDEFEVAIGGLGLPGGACVDADADGFFAPPAAGTCPDAVDCNDANPSVWPGAPETCDGFDNDCNGAADVVSCGEGVCARVADICAVPQCSPRLELLTSELCDDGLDNDCDGSTDDGVPIQPTLAGALGGLFVLLEGLGEGGVPADCGNDPRVCCPGGNPLSPCGSFEAVLAEPPVVVATSDPIRFDYTFRVRIKTIEAIRVELFGVDCGLVLDTTAGTTPFVDVRGQMIFHPVLDPLTNPSFPDLSELVIENLEVEDAGLTGHPPFCLFQNVGIGFASGVVSHAVGSHLQERRFGLCKP